MYDDVLSRGFAIIHVKDCIAKVETASGIVQRFLLAIWLVVALV
jgi:hypothetical protein